MKTRPLVLCEEERAEIARVLEHAKLHPQSLRDCLRSKSDPKFCPGENPEFVCMIPFGYRCVYSHEQQPAGLVQHFSLSVVQMDPRDEGTVLCPSVEAGMMLMKEFGLTKPDHIWTETILLNGHEAVSVNAIQLIRETVSREEAKGVTE